MILPIPSRRRAAALAAVALSVLALAGCGDDDDTDVSATEPATESSTVPSVTSPTAPGEVGATTLTATLSGSKEVPGPGVADGVGSAELTIKGDEVCYDLKATMGEEPTAAHVHQGADGASGPVVVDLSPSFEPGESAFLAAACTTPAAGQAAKLAADPGGFYVNIHTAEHPDGALRGQLAKS